MAAQKSLQGIEAEGADECPECHSKDLSKRGNEIFCKKCGYVFD